MLLLKFSIDLKLGQLVESVWHGVFAIGVDGVGDSIFGSRLPAVFRHQSHGVSSLRICNTYVSTANHGYQCWTSPEFGLDQWFNLKITQSWHGAELLYKIFADDEEIYSLVNPRGSEYVFENANAWIGRAPTGGSVSPGSFRNFQYFSKPVPAGYTFDSSCGSALYYRVHDGTMTWNAATAQCTSDHSDATLPVPRSG